MTKEIPAAGRALNILHPVITVSDMDEALHFYRGLLGMRVEVDFVHDPDEYAKVVRYDKPDARAAILKCVDGTEIELLEFRSPRGKQTSEKAFEDAGITFVTIIVDDVSLVVERIQAAGYEVHGPIIEYANKDGNVLVVYCFGPDRTGLTLAQYL